MKMSPSKVRLILLVKWLAYNKLVQVKAALQKDESGKTVKEIKSYADFVSAFMDLGIGRVDAVIADGVIARYLMTKEPGKYKIVEGTDYV